MKVSALYFFLFLSLPCFSQGEWDFSYPLIAHGEFEITDTIYMSVDGSDSNTGSYDFPVASFDKAISLLPFGTPNIHNGNAYGLIRIKEGHYNVASGFQQHTNQFVKNNTYKNVSIEGIGEVIISGTESQLAEGHLIKLLGSHIFVRNVTLKKGNIHGILIGGDHNPSDILVDSVTVDSVKSFSLLCVNAHRVLVRNSKFLRGSQITHENLEPGPNCQWPSGLKFLNSKYVVSHNNEIAFTRGEGLNFHNSEYGLAYNNLIHDNPTNIYCDNSSKIIIRNNLIYGTPGYEQYWKTCPADTLSPSGGTGVLLANEGGGCSSGVVYENCHSKCILTGRLNHHIDSIFIYNNFFINTEAALSLWQGITDALGGPNCLNNIFFEHNTILGLVGADLQRPVSAIYGFFPNAYNTITGFGYATVQNLHIRANLISLPQRYSNRDLINIKLHSSFPIPFDMNVDENLVNMDDERLSPSNTISENIITDITPNIDSLIAYLTPCDEHLNLIKEVPTNPKIIDDFRYYMRPQFMTNVGALSYQPCTTNTIDQFSHRAKSEYIIYPNPTSNEMFVESLRNHDKDVRIEIFDIHGKLYLEQILKHAQSNINLSRLKPGVYFAFIHSSTLQEVTKLVIN